MSFDAKEIIKLLTIESKWFVSILIHMSKLVNENEGMRFQFREEEDNLINRMKEQTSSYNNSVLKFPFPLDHSIIDDYFNTENHLGFGSDILDKLLNKLMIFDLHEYYDAITFYEGFSQSFEFIKIFDLVSGGRCFNSNCM